MVIAIDGYSSCGKSTLAKDMASELGYVFIDSGAMYRAVALLFLQKSISIDLNQDYTKLLTDNALIHFENLNGQNTTFLNNENVESKIRSQSVAQIVSQVSKNSSIRRFLVAQQRLLGKDKGVVMDGRDIGTVVFPDADLKLFITADVDVRASRRHKELSEKGINISQEEIKDNLVERDHIDSTRYDSPLLQAEDAILLDTSNHSRESQLEEAIEHLVSKIQN